jgi:hypothetical protein
MIFAHHLRSFVADLPFKQPAIRPGQKAVIIPRDGISNGSEGYVLRTSTDGKFSGKFWGSFLNTSTFHPEPADEPFVAINCLAIIKNLLEDGEHG